MQDFLDLKGASGAVYRFTRVAKLSDLPAIAGNFVYVRGPGAHPAIVCCGSAESLLNAGVRWPVAVQSHRAEAIFVRKNVSWKTRLFEHNDLVSGQEPEMLVTTDFEKH